MEQVINLIRDILRKEGITGMDSINHCIIFLVSRLLDKDLCEKLGIDEKYAFENIIKDEDGNDLGEQELYNKIYVRGSKECLIGKIVTVLKFSNIKFKLEGAHNLKLIYDKLKNLKTEDLMTKYDLIGTIYEYHLRTGTSNSLRDLGQYYTPRIVINYMIKLCDPKMKDRMIEKITDPTMGTGGFLTMAIKYLNSKYKNIDWKKNKDNIIGFDIDENVRNMALINILLEIGELCDNTVVKQDTLHNDLKFDTDGSILENVDIILANEPMGLKNIIYTSCCDRIKKFKMKGTKSEPLFLQLFMSLLNDNGRCAVIVPDGVLFNESKLHSGTRKYLIENFNLKKVVSLNDDFFLNTGVKTSILFFIKDVNKTNEVDFCEIHIKDSGTEEKSIIKVKYDKLVENNYSLFVNKYNIKDIKKIEGIEYKKLGEICEFLPKGKRKSSEGLNSGKYPLYFCSVLGHLWLNEFDFNDECIMINTTNGSGKCEIFYCKKEYSVAESVIRFKSNSDKIKTGFIFHYLKMNKYIVEHTFKGSNQKQLSKEDFKKIEIPIPSMPIQEEIVEKLDILNSNIERSKEMIKEYKNIIKYYVDCHTRNEKNIIKIGDFCEIKAGKFNSKDKKSTGKYPFYSSEVNSPVGFIDEFCFDYENYIILIKDGGAGHKKYGDQIGLGKVFRVKSKSSATSHQNAIIIKNDFNDIDINYLYWYLTSIKNDIMDLALYTTGLGCIKRKAIENIDVFRLTKEKQEEIVKYCDNLNNMISNIETQIKNDELLMKQILENYLNVKKEVEKVDDKKKIKDIDDESSSESDDDEKPKKVNKKKK